MNLGIFYILLSIGSFSILHAIVKYLDHIPAIQIIFFRALISLVLSLAAIKVKGIKSWGNNKVGLFLRGFFGAIALTFYFHTLQVLPLGTAVILQQLSPIFAVLMATVILKESASPIQYLLILICFLGAYQFKGNGDGDYQLEVLPIIFGVLGAIFSALAYNLVRYLKTTEDPLIIILYFPLVTLPLVGVYCFFNWTPVAVKDILPLLGVGIFTQLGQFYMTKAYHLKEISELAIYRYLSLPIAIVMGFFLFNETPKSNDLLGAGIIVASLLSSTFVRNKRRKA